LAKFPCLFDTTASMKEESFYMGVLNGSTPTGSIKYAGAAASMNPPPTVAADPNRRSLLRTEWIQEYFNTTTTPAGHGLNLVDSSMGNGFACYSFVPKSDIPLKVIVLDDTQSETGKPTARTIFTAMGFLTRPGGDGFRLSLLPVKRPINL
jgi:hypothetical protein